MPRGYGMGRGGYWLYWGLRHHWPGVPADRVKEGDAQRDAVYIGPCRCGWGPHAYYRTTDGKIVHATMLSVTEPVAPAEPSEQKLRAEIEALRSRIAELEKALEKKAKPSE